MGYAKKKLKRRYIAAIKKTAKTITKDFDTFYNTAINEFYKHYKPKYYKRLKVAYKASSLYGKGAFTVNPEADGVSFMAEITVDPANVKGEPYVGRVTPFGGVTTEETSNKERILDRTINKGIHGLYSGDINRMNRNRRKRNWIRMNVPPKMNPAPVKVEQKLYKEKYGSATKREKTIDGYMEQFFKNDYIIEYLQNEL